MDCLGAFGLFLYFKKVQRKTFNTLRSIGHSLIIENSEKIYSMTTFILL